MKERRADAPTLSHSVGKPISQREKRGFNWYSAVFSVSAFDESVVSPEIC